MKYFRLGYDYILWEISYVNVNMLLATIPVYESEKDKKDKVEGEIKSTDELSQFLEGLTI